MTARGSAAIMPTEVVPTVFITGDSFSYTPPNHFAFGTAASLPESGGGGTAPVSPVLVWNGTAWVARPILEFDGTTWVPA